ncbi:CDP-glycerol glycerophosphotransferase family protein [Staphylococcus americanisciuri]|uniref:CDP-glycerol glycerophosphotransferase family protein n=1 Tax=Staphylococcus americanisciuri TaxID=2973940 RepID=A0ABT2F1Y5_9STAP|nr:CDP-glycerol glycerophosphotransferase family protein [Staphylococcus americanisciuri]MCS4486440.1 CDP-glycerol glycerophosphotransferase family protein [Staphylococcus americanisciuri]
MRIKVLGYNIFQVGGTSQSNLNLVRALVAGGHDVTYVNFVGFQKRHVQELKQSKEAALAGAQVVAFRGIQSLLDTDMLIITRENFFNMAREVKQHDANIIVLGEIHGPLAYLPEQTTLALDAIDAVRVSTAEIAESFAQHYAYPYVFPMYVNTAHINWQIAPPITNRNLLVKARFEDEVKDVSYVLKLMRYAIHEKGQHDVHLYLQGYGPSLELYKRLIDYYALTNYVHINEETPEAYVYISASPYETLGYSILESIASGQRALIYPGDDKVLAHIYKSYNAVDFIQKDLATDYKTMMTAFEKLYALAQQQEDQQRYERQFVQEDYAKCLITQTIRCATEHAIQVTNVQKPKITAKQQYWEGQRRRLVGKLKRSIKLPKKLTHNVWSQRISRAVLLGEARLKRMQRQQSVRENHIFVESFHGKNFSGDPKYIALALQYLHPEAIFYVSAANEFVDMEIRSYGMIPVRFGSRDYIQAFDQCRYVIINGNLWDKLTKQKEQCVIQTWHGFPLKRMVNDLMDLEERRRQAAQFKPRMLKWDVLLTSSRQYERYVTSAFDLDAHPSLRIFPYGAPRNSYLIRYQQDEQERAMIQEKYLFTKDATKCYILFCPTWRKGTRNNVSDVDLVELIKTLPSNYEIIVKLHPNEGHLQRTYQAMHQRIHCFANELVDIQELYLLADVLITDYSSAMFDYAHLQRPILILAEDTEAYRQEIGFYFDMAELTSIQRVRTDVTAISSAIKEALNVNHSDIIERFMTYDTATSDETVARKIWQC